jgi:hypothetical protein
VPSTLGGPFKTVNGVPNQIDPSVFDKAAVTIAETALPTGQVPATGQVNYALSSVTESFDEGTLRLDYALSSKQRIFARSFIQSLVEPATVVKGNVLATNEAGMGRYYNETISHTWIVNPTLVNVASAGWTRNDWSNEAEVFDSSGNAFCLSKYINVADPAGSCYVEGLNVENAFSTPWAEPNRNIRTTWTFTDTLTKTVKNHTIVAGMDLYHQWADTQTQYPAQAIVGFDGYAGDVGFGLADFLLGEVSSMQQGAFQYSPTKGWEMAFYGQDQYKLKPNLTITAGLRWEPEIPPEDVNGGSAFIPGQQSVRYPGAPLGLNFPGDKGVDAALMPNDYANFAPRIGVAWQPHRLPHTALRGGFGLFSAPISYSYYNHTVGIAPFCPFYSLSATAADPINFDNPWHGFQSTGGQSPFTPTTFVQNPKAPSSATFTTPFSVPASFSRNFKLGITQSWTASIEQQLFSQYALHLAYVGSQSYHQTTKVDMNPGIYADGNARSTYPLFSSVIVDTPAGTASYHSLQIGMERRMVKGLQFQSNFTWSKAIDLSSSGNISFGGELGDPFDYAWDRGISDLNIPLSWVSNFVYVTPTLDRSNGFLKNALGAWELSTIWSLQSGRPFSVSGGNGNDSSGSLQGGDRADLTGKPFNVRQGSKSQWLNEYFNKAAFAPNLPGTFGDSGRNLLKGPGIDTADVAVIKNWKAAERYGLQFRWEMFNAFNHASFANPNSDSSPTNGSEGQISSIGPIAPRVMQGGLKLTF